MTAKAKELGMENTNFSNSSGINDPDNYSTVKDILIMSTILLKNTQNITNGLVKKNLLGIEQEEIPSHKVIEILYFIKILVQME